MSLIIIGRRGFIGKNLTNYFLEKKIDILNVSVDKFLKLSKNELINFHSVINCSINKKIIKNKYHANNDYDFKICKKIQNLNIRYFFLSSRKVYGKNKYPNEESKLKPSCNYSKNKLISENKCKNILNNKIVILRISNLIGFRSKNKKRLHKTFIDNFFIKLKKGNIDFNFKDYKDFLSIEQFCKIIYKFYRNKNILGVFNISIGTKIYFVDLINSLIKFQNKKVIINNTNKIENNDNFVLDNRKLLKKLKINLKKKDLFKYCEILGSKMN